MRVIAGKAKGHRLKPVPGDKTRPITDRAKENLFNILGAWTRETRWIDLFAGTGQVGIEALSRGAKEVVFVESAPAAIQVIHGNLTHTKLSDRGRVLHTDAFIYLRHQVDQPFDVIYVAPPQYKSYWSKALSLIDKKADSFLTEKGEVIVQIDPIEYQKLTLNNLFEYEKRTYGSTTFCFYGRAGSTES